MHQRTTTQSSPKPAFKDHLALWLLRLAKLRRRSFTARHGENYDQFYEEFFEDKDIEAYDRDRRMAVRRETINAYIAAHVPSPARILDVGCGLGDVLSGLPEGHELYATDYARHNITAASRRLGSRAQIRQGSIYEIPFDSNTMDVCLCLEVLEHIEDDARGVHDIARVLKPGGILIAAVPYTYYWPEYMRLLGHFRHYTRQSFSALMNQNGLETETYLANYPNWHQTYTRHYAMIRAQAATIGRLFGRSSLYTFRWPWHHKCALERLADRLEPLRQQDGRLDYATLDTSTFLIARKGR